MEVRIRLQKAGNVAQKTYNYRIVAMSKASARDGRALEILGHYDAAKKPAQFEINQDKLDKWLSRGAKMSETVSSLVRQTKRQKG